MMLEMLEIEPQQDARNAVIWLHGLGADGHDFEPLIRQWGLAEALDVHFVLTHAPLRPVTLNGGMVMRAWYDIYDLEYQNREDGAGIRQASEQLLELIERERQRGIASDRIVLAGFSQGGAVCLHTALRIADELAGVLALSCYLPLPETLEAEHRAGTGLAIRMDHGDRDPIVPFGVARRSCERLVALGYRVEFNRYPMEHSLCPQQIDSLRDWLGRRLD